MTSPEQTTTATKDTTSMSPTDLLSVSIVMPSYNRRERLERLLHHLTAQDYPRELVEIVVCLDGCTDGSGEMLKHLQADYPLQLTILEQPQSGPAAARNRAIAAAHNDIVLFLDDDVFPVASLIREHIKHHIKDEKAVVIGTMLPPSDFERPFWVKWEEVQLEKQYNDMINGKWEVTSRQFYTGNATIRRHWLVEAGGFNESFKRAEDVELAYRLDTMGLKYYFEPAAAGVHYATRTFKSWETARYLYGKSDVIIARQGFSWVLRAIFAEQQERNLMTRWLCRTVKWEWLYNLLRISLFWLAQALVKLKRENYSYKVLSGLANMVYWKGLHDELQANPTPELIQLQKQFKLG